MSKKLKEEDRAKQVSITLEPKLLALARGRAVGLDKSLNQYFKFLLMSDLFPESKKTYMQWVEESKNV